MLGFFVFKKLPAGGIFVCQMQEIVVILGYKKIIIGDNDMTKDIWRDVEGYEGLYQVSDQGRVKSLERKGRRKERFLKPGMDKDGYLFVNLWAGGKQKNHKVHRLVCQAFHENPGNKPQVNHINEIKTDNRASNLEWCTYAENNNHGTRNERVAKAQSKPVAQYAQDGELIKIWPSTREAERQTGFRHGYIGQSANGKRKQAYGFIWKYVS